MARKRAGKRGRVSAVAFSGRGCQILFSILGGTANASRLAEFLDLTHATIIENLRLWVDAGILSSTTTGRLRTYTVNTEALTDLFCETLYASVEYRVKLFDAVEDEVLVDLLKIAKSKALPALPKLMKKNTHFRTLIKTFVQEAFPLMADLGPNFDLSDATEYFIKRVGQQLQTDKNLYKNVFSIMDHSKDKSIQEYAWLLIFLESELTRTHEPFETGIGFRKAVLDGLNTEK